MYTILDKKDSDQRHTDDIEPLYGPPILKKNRRFKDAVSWGCILLVLLCVVVGLIVVCVLLINHERSSDLQTAQQDVHNPELTSASSSSKNGNTQGSVTHAPRLDDVEDKKEDQKDTTSIVRTNCGIVKGSVEDGVRTFKGIPYALPPVGEYRWKAPVAREIKPEVCNPDIEIEATNFGAKCMQWDPTGHSLIGSEDCLYTNVWAPNQNATGLEVMVFIHGGGTQTHLGHLYGAGLLSGSGNEPGFMPTPELVEKANMVFVTFNYRLGPFGFLAADVRDPDTNQPINGNFGLMDQHLAMEWVKDNARVFGGSPDKVTVFGVGAGASSILIHLASSHQPVFQRAWAASPSPHYNTTLQTAYRQNQEFLVSSSCGSVRKQEDIHGCLYDLSPTEVFQAYPYSKWENRQFRDLPSVDEHKNIRGLINVDGDFLKKIPYEIWSSPGDHHDIPILVGTAAQEIDDWPLPPNIQTWSWVEYESYMFDRLNSFSASDLAAKVQMKYPKVGSPELQFTSIVSDMRETCPVSAVTQLLGHFWQEPVYRYVANYAPSPGQQRDTPSGGNPQQQQGGTPQTDSVLSTSGGTVQSTHHYAYHSIDMYHFFNQPPSVSDGSNAGHEFSEQMRESVLDFARTGRIKGWDYYPDSTMLISSQLQHLEKYHNEQCELWRDYYMYPSYAWMNK